MMNGTHFKNSVLMKPNDFTNLLNAYNTLGSPNTKTPASNFFSS